MLSPYLNTRLYSQVTLQPQQMNNNLYLNLKKNLDEKVTKKCFRNYGYIMEIYEILEFKDGLIEPENLMASALFNVTFSCRLCRPLKNKQIVCQVNRVNKVLITVENGPVLVIITNDRINDKIFYTDNNNNLRYRKENESLVLQPKDFVLITIISIVFNHGDNKIKAIGFLENMANEKQVESFYKDLYNTDQKEVNLEEYIKSDSTNQNEKASNDESNN